MTAAETTASSAAPLIGRRPGLLRSFWIAGFEGADHLNRHGQPLSMTGLTDHDAQLEADYDRLVRLDMRGVRESIGWRLTERDGSTDFSRLDRIALAASERGIQVLWTLMHYGTPADVSVLDDRFVDRFARFSEAVARRVRALCPDEIPVYTPINEISFLCWALCYTGVMHPFDGSLGDRHAYDIKRRLAHASIRAIDAILEVDPRARFVLTDPLIRIHADERAPELAWQAAQWHGFQYQALDIIGGLAEPQLGGSRRHLDIVGLNYYHDNQWVHPSGERLHWCERDPRRAPLSEMLAEVRQRFDRPLVIAETSHIGAGRAAWLDDVMTQVVEAERRGVPIDGVCLYPILDRPDWCDHTHWHNSGLWDAADPPAGRLDRVLCRPYARALRRWQRRLHDAAPFLPRQSTPSGTSMSTLIVFSHLRWNFVFQRPQHLLSRLARDWRVLFVEEPMRGAGEPHFERFTPCAGVEVLRARTSIAADGFHDDQIPALSALLEEHLREHGIDDYAVWFYTPMALPLLQGLQPSKVIYDCMDELSHFKNAPRQLVQRENALLKVADLVTTGGPSLYRAKRDRHPNVHCFSSSVDSAHYAPRAGAAAAAAVEAAQRDIPHPRLGFFGVIDERFDLGLIDAAAAARPDWQFVMIGPVVKINPAALPSRANIHWLGGRTYEELPVYTAGWDVCLLPFAINEATKFISPTKTLEYMAAEKPIVSTPITDVVEPYGDVVWIANDAAEFVAACAAALAESPTERAARVRRMGEIVARTSWDATARAIDGLLRTPERPSKSEAAAVVLSGTARVKRERAAHYGQVVLGAGPTGLSAAYHLGAGSLLVEREARVGGWCRSIQDGGFTFDHAGHIMFSNDPDVLRLYDKLLGDNLHWQDREAWIYSKSVYTRYPFQGALYGLPPKVLKECIVGAIEARFGPLKGPGAGKLPSHDRAPQNFEEFIDRVWGAGVAKHFAIPYNKKIWGVPLNEMETSWMGGRVPLPDLEQMIEGALEPAPKPMGPNARFGYPLRGGFQALMDAFVPHLEGELWLDAAMTAVSARDRTITLADGRTVGFDTLVSTVPLPHLVQALGDEAPAEVRQAAAGLRHTSVRCVNLGVARPSLTDKHWIYYPEDTVFHRIFVQGNASPHCNPPGGFGITCEITYSPSKPLPCEGEALIRRCIDDCIRVGLIRADDRILVSNEVDMPIAYVIYDHARAANVKVVRDWLSRHGILLAGRYSEWEYYNSDHAFIAGKKAAQAVEAAARTVAVVAGGAGVSAG